MAKPIFVLVPGAWHTPEIYTATTNILETHGYRTLGLPLPSTGADPPHTSFDGDVDAIRACLTQLVEQQGEEVVLVSHSYAGMPATEAPINLGLRERKQKGLTGGMVRLVYIMALAMPEGFQPTAGGQQFPEWMRVDSEKQIVTVLPEDAKAVFYNDFPDDEADRWATKLRHQSVGVFNSTSTYAAWRYIPSTFLIGTEDKTSITPALADFMVDSARQQVPTAFDTVERCEGAGHCLMFSRPEWLADALRRAAGEKI